MDDRFRSEHALETYRSLMLYGSTGLTFVLVANGAAAVAIVTFLGHWAASGSKDLPDFRWPLGTLLAGIVFGGMATATAYFTQLRLYNESVGRRSDKVSHTFWLNVSAFLIVVGILAFGVGSFLAVARLT